MILVKFMSNIVIAPTSAGISVTVDGVTHTRGLTGEQLVSIGQRFIDAGKERLVSDGPGNWTGRGIALEGCDGP